MLRKAAYFGAALLVACGGRSFHPEDQLTAKRPPYDVVVVGDGLAAAGGARLGDAAVTVDAIEGTPPHDDLVLHAAKDALADAAVAAHALGEDRAAKAAATVAAVGSLFATSEEMHLARIRGEVGDRVYRATCASAASSSTVEIMDKLDVSCALVRAVEAPVRHWQLRMTTDGIRVDGVLEPHRASGVEAGNRVFRVLSHGPFFMPNTRFTVDGGDEADLYEIVMLRTYRRAPRLYADDVRLAAVDPETRDVLRLLPLLLELFPWPEAKHDDQQP